MSSSGGRSDGRTGSPGDGGNTCAACHSGGSFGANLDITTNIPAGGYELNTDYTITVKNTSSAPRYGFQLTAENASDIKVGSFKAGSGSRVAGDRVTHSSPSSTGSWSFTWKSPTTDRGEVKFYATSIAADGTGGTSGDQVVTTRTSGFSVLSAPKFEQLDFEMYPNPAVNSVKIQLPSGASKAKVEVFNYSGQLIKKEEITARNNSVNIQNLAQGLYVLKVNANGKLGVKKLVKQ